MKAYNQDYLFDAMETLGEAFDCAVNRAGMAEQEFFDLFISTGVAEAFGAGTPRYVTGMSGIELFLDVCYKAGIDAGVALIDELNVSDSPSYWCGWVLAYWQWASARPFRSIARIISMDDILSLYQPLHEAAEEKFVDVMESRAAKMDAPLKVIREARSMTQQALSEASGVSLRAIQQYEQRYKNINHARGVSLQSLARALGCRIEDLFEYPL